MLSCVTRVYTKCDDGSGCGRPHEGRLLPAECQAVRVFYCAMDPKHGPSQCVANIIASDGSSRAACKACCVRGNNTMFTKRVNYLKLPMVLTLFTYPMQVSAGHNPLLTHVLFLL